MRLRSPTHPLASRLAPTVPVSARFAGSALGGRDTPGGADDADPSPSPTQGIIAGTLEVNADRAAKAHTRRNADGTRTAQGAVNRVRVVR